MPTALLRATALCLALTWSPGLAQTTAEETDAPITLADIVQPHAQEIADNIDWITSDLAAVSLEKTVRHTLFVMAHELAHLLIGELELPVLGWEEDAADTLAVALLLADESESNFKTLRAATEAWAMMPPGQLPPEMLYDEHSLDIQRAYHAVCIMVGRNLERYAPIADIMQMPEHRRQRCVWESKRALDSWRSVLDPHRRAEGDTTGSTVYWNYLEPVEGLQTPLASALLKTAALETFAKLVADEFPMPRDIYLETRRCGAQRAFYDPYANRIAICYEFIQAHFEKFVLSEAEKLGIVPQDPQQTEDAAAMNENDQTSGFGTNSVLGDGAWSISVSTDGGMSAVTSDGQVITTRPGAGGSTRIHTGGQRTCPGAGTWPTCY